jgi:hypothetical protein
MVPALSRYSALRRRKSPLVQLADIAVSIPGTFAIGCTFADSSTDCLCKTIASGKSWPIMS